MYQTVSYNLSAPKVLWTIAGDLKPDEQNWDDFLTHRLAEYVLEERGDDLDDQTREHIQAIEADLSHE